MPGSTNEAARTDLTEVILQRFVQICTAIFAGERESWLSVDLTMPQAKTLLLIVTWGRVTGSRLGAALGAGLPSVTRLVDRLEEQGLVRREIDSLDRRVTYIAATEEGRRLIENLLSYRRETLSACLDALETPELTEVLRALESLLRGAQRAGRLQSGCEANQSAEPIQRG
jgi:DNA-binding MarR family transcriptional regulator